MPRATKGCARKRSRKRLLNKTEGYWGGRGNLYRKAIETYIRAMVFSFRDRKARKRISGSYGFPGLARPLESAACLTAVLLTD